MLSEKSISIKLIGGFAIYYGDENITSHLCTKKTARLLEYLILKKGRPVNHNDLAHAIWKDSCAPVSALRTMLHRLRAAASEYPPFDQCIVTNIGAYAWNIEMPCSIDFLEIERHALSAKNASLRQREEDCLYVLEAYKGQLLPDDSSEWVAVVREELREHYIRCVVMLTDIYAQRGELKKATDVLNAAIAITGEDGRLLAGLSRMAGKDAEFMRLRENQNAAGNELSKIFDTDRTVTFCDAGLIKAIVNFYSSIRYEEAHVIVFKTDVEDDVSIIVHKEYIEQQLKDTDAFIACTWTDITIAVKGTHENAVNIAERIKQLINDLGGKNTAYSIKRI